MQIVPLLSSLSGLPRVPYFHFSVKIKTKIKSFFLPVYVVITLLIYCVLEIPFCLISFHLRIWTAEAYYYHKMPLLINSII